MPVQYLIEMRKSLALSILFLFLLAGCGGKDNVTPSKDSLMTIEALSSINVIKSAYQEKDRDVLQNHLGDAIAEEIKERLFFEKGELSITPRMVRIDGLTVVVDVNWQGTWMIKGEMLKDRGIAAFVFDGSPMRLVRVDGDNPFYAPLVK